MIGTLVSLLVVLVVFGLLFWLVSLLPLPGPWKQVVQVLSIIILILLVASYFLGWGGMGNLPRFR